jgi:SAM-dependent methyltransferase
MDAPRMPPTYRDRERAESFGAIAGLYDRARPSYPPALIDALLAGGPRRALDVGCGTGIAAALLADRGCDVLGIEIDERMAAVARAKGLTVEVAPFESWEPRGRTFDLVIAGQAWHWVEPRIGALRAADVLVAGGRIGLFWNGGEPEPAVRERLAPIYAVLEPGLRAAAITSERRRRRTQDAIAALAECGRFGPVAVSRFPWRRTVTTDGWIDYLASHSSYQTLPEEHRERLLAAIGAALDDTGGTFEVAHDTVLISARRRP